MKKRFKLFTAAVIIMTVLTMLFLIAVDNDIKVREYSEITSKVTENKKLLLITDLHSVIYDNNQSTLIEKIDEIDPDAILLGGDIVDDNRDETGSRILFEYIGSKYDCYYVSGNHEYWSYRIDEIKDMIRGYGITVLEGEGVKLSDEIMLWGVDDPDCGKEQYGAYDDWYGQLYRCNSQLDNNVFNILLSHRPERTEDYNGCNFDLVLSGHAHGGQWRIPFVLNGLYAPNQGMFPKYAGGKYKLGSVDMIVSRGLALSDIPRIFNPPEIVVVNIGSNINQQ